MRELSLDEQGCSRFVEGSIEALTGKRRRRRERHKSYFCAAHSIPKPKPVARHAMHVRAHGWSSFELVHTCGVTFG